MLERVNPFVILKGAELVRPDIEWQIIRTSDGTFVAVAMDPDLNGVFDPITSDADAMKLERALKKEGWLFDYVAADGVFAGDKYGMDVQYDPSDTMLLLKCVAATTGLPMNLE